MADCLWQEILSWWSKRWLNEDRMAENRGYDYYFGGVNDGALKTSTWVNGYYVDESGKWTGQESYKYSKGECVSEFGISHNKGEYSYLGFWHSYGESASCEDFIFQWKEGKYEYSVRGVLFGRDVYA